MTVVNGPWEIHRAEWVVPVCAPPLQNGAVLTRGDRIIAVGNLPGIRKDAPAGARLTDHGRAALFPSLVNAHTHLELSGLKGKIPLPQPGFRDWVQCLLALRAGMQPHLVAEGIRSGEAELSASGTGLFADITNGAALAVGPPADSRNTCCPPHLPPPEAAANQAGGPTARLVFLELLGFNLDSVASAMPVELRTGRPLNFSLAAANGSGKPGRRSHRPEFIPVPHSVYSVSPAIISECKEMARSSRQPFAIHVAEHLDEIEFLQSGQGFCRELLDRLGRWAPAWTPPGKTPVEYLDDLGVLDSRTLLVHAVHMTEADWALAAARQCTVVFCPRSNKNLGAGRPWIEKALSIGMNCALGTDSLAGNTDLDLFAEAAFALDEHPSIDPRKVLEMITVNPAASLGRSDDFGAIEPGRKALMLAVEIREGGLEKNLAEAIIQSGKQGAWKWVS